MSKADRPARAPQAPASAVTPPALEPRVIVLQADWREWFAGKVLRADADMQSALAIEGVKFRDATQRERAIGGVL